MSWDRGTATITGSGFGIKGADPRPLVWAPLRTSLNPDSKLSRVTSWIEPPKADLANVRGMDVARFNLRRDIGWPPDVPADFTDANGFQIRLAAPPDRLYLRGKHYLDFDPVAEGGMNHKLWRAIPDVLEGGRINWYSNWHHVAGGDGRVAIESVAEQVWNDSLYPIRQVNAEEWIYLRSSPDVRNGRLAHRINNQNFGDINPCLNCTATDSGVTTFGMYDDLTNVPNGLSTPEWWVYYRDLYYDDTFARVMVGDAATYATCTTLEPQIPLAWSDTSITVLINTGQFETLAGLWVYVFNANNQIVYTQQIPGYSQALPSVQASNTSRNYGPVSIPLGANSVSVRLSREAWPDTGSEVARARMQYSLDNGATWGAINHVGSMGGDKIVKSSGAVLQHTSATWPLPEPNNPNRLIRGQVQHIADVRCGLQMMFD